MSDYTFYLEGLNREVTVHAPSIKEARRKVWLELPEEDAEKVEYLDWIETDRHE